MFFSFRSKLFAISVALLAVFVLGVGIYLHQTLKGWTESRVQADLKSRTQLIVNALDDGGASGASAAEFVQSLGGVNDPRVTLIAADGSVLADTHLSQAKLDDAENHAGRPEFRAAVDDELGLSQRYSTSVDAEMLYVAMPTADDEAVVRVALALSDVDEALAHLRLLLLIGVFLGLGAAIFMSSVASRLMSKTLNDVLARTRTEQAQVTEKSVEHGSLREITKELEETLELLASQRNRFRAVLDGMSEGVVATDEELTIILSNRAVGRLLQSELDDEAGSLRDWLPDDKVEALVNSEEASVEFDVTTSARRHIRVRATRRPDSSGFILVFHDVTAIRQLETMRRDFVANVSHELRTPVTIIQANAETLLDGAIEAPEHARPFTEGIHRHSERLSRLIADLLDLSRIEAREMDFDSDSLRLATVLDQVVVDMVSDTEDAEVQIDNQIDGDLKVWADGDALEQVLINLLGNAIKYGGSAVTVEVDARQRGEMVLVEVKDNGPGVAPEHRERVFERFYRIDEGRSSKMGGTGLGLSIVKHMVSSMGGEVGYRAGADGGSIFWFTLSSG